MRFQVRAQPLAHPPCTAPTQTLCTAARARAPRCTPASTRSLLWPFCTTPTHSHSAQLCLCGLQKAHASEHAQLSGPSAQRMRTSRVRAQPRDLCIRLMPSRGGRLAECMDMSPLSECMAAPCGSMRPLHRDSETRAGQVRGLRLSVRKVDGRVCQARPQPANPLQRAATGGPLLQQLGGRCIAAQGALTSAARLDGWATAYVHVRVHELGHVRSVCRMAAARRAQQARFRRPFNFTS